MRLVSSFLLEKNRPQTPSPSDTLPFNPHYRYSEDLQQVLAGKQLLQEELDFSEAVLTLHKENGYVKEHQAIIQNSWKSQCLRCGNDAQHLFAVMPCARCGQSCTYCRKCIMTGRVNQCSRLISWSGPPLSYPQQPQPLAWDGELSIGQEAASHAVVSAISNRQELLVWAVCGAGKTEVLFQGITESLSQGEKVCIATPRTDVVHELTPRLRAAFPHSKILSLFGGSNDRLEQGQLVVATTHQLIRYYRAFDTVIIDEVDAFPYRMDKSLQYAVEQASKPKAATIYLTATPSRAWQQRVKKGDLPAVKIPARYHRYPLPVPNQVWIGNWRKALKKGGLPKRLISWIESRLNSNTPMFLFVPDLQVLEEVTALLKEINAFIESVHAEDEKRREKIVRFREGKLPLLVTTTILERGVTVAGLEAAVLGSEAGVFTESALVQIAGRVGRSADHPHGNITFFHYGRTEAMEQATNHIEQMNRDAFAAGLLR